MVKLNEKVVAKYFNACSQPQSSYALKHLVDGGQLTPERRFRQAVIELNVSQTNLREAQHKRAELRIDLAEAEDEARSNNKLTTFDRQRLDLKIAKMKSDLTILDRGLGGAEREMNIHLNMLQQFQDEMGFTEETTEEEVYARMEQAERDHYTLKLALDVAANFVAARGGPPQGVTLAMQQLPEEDVSRIMKIVQAAIPQMMENKYTDALHSPEGVQALERIGETLQMAAKESADKNPPTSPMRSIK